MKKSIVTLILAKSGEIRIVRYHEQILAQYNIESLTPHRPPTTYDADVLINLVESNSRGNFIPTLKPGDALVLAEAENVNLRLYTNDVRFFKRGVELQANIQYLDINRIPGNTRSKQVQGALDYPTLVKKEPWRVCR